MTGKITGGEVGYGRTVKTGDFENKRVDVKLTFTVEDGRDHAAILTAAAQEAHDKAHEMLGLKVAAVKQTVSVSIPTKEAAAAAMNAADKAAEKSPKSAKTEPKKPEPAIAAGEEFGDAFNEDAAEAQPEISDVQLSAAMNRKVAELKPKYEGAAPKKIKELINTFVEPPKKSHDIPQNLRAEFLKKLEALT